jgi:hypothetical protein
MKNLSFTFVLLFSNLALLFGQDSIPKEISSIGKFEIKTTTLSILDELQNTLDTKVKICSSFSNYSKYQQSKDNYILQLVRDTVNEYNSPFGAKYCDLVKIYAIQGYSVANIELKNLELTFMNDTLIQFKCDGTTDFIEAIHLKYGKGKLRQTEKEVTCEVGRLGTEVKLKETAIFETWGNADIKANSTISVFYNRKCEKNYLSYFVLSSFEASKEMNKCEDLKKLEDKKRKEEQKKKSLDGF